MFLDVDVQNGGEMVVPIICHQTKYGHLQKEKLSD